VAQTELRLRNPGGQAGGLLEALLEASQGATSGGAIFAWTNRSGVRTLFQDPTFKQFLAASPFELVVGLDSITDGPAIEALKTLVQDEKNLTVRALLHTDNAMFHPKLAWFMCGLDMILLVGSGNLTMGGLRNNWEAFTVSRHTGTTASSIKQQLADWLNEHAHLLLPIDDPRVLARAQQNTGNERSLKKAAKTPPATAASDPDDAVLVAEIPRAGNRWSQANFDLENYEGFFGAKVGTQRRILLYAVHSGGQLGSVESRPSVEVRSQNYRFELDQARGLAYPSAGRPVGVFLRLGTGDFLYELLMPGTPDHAAVGLFLSAHWSGPPTRMRRYRTNVATLRAAWPSGAIWQANAPDL